MANYNISGFIDKLEALLDQTKKGNLTEEEKAQFTQDLITALKNEADWLNHYPLEENDISGNNGLFAVFQQLIDLDDQGENNYLNYIEDIIKNQNSGSRENWNESIKHTINYFRKHFRPYSDTITDNEEIKVNWEEDGESKSFGYTIAEAILQANAGYSFSQNGETSEWVKPLQNIDEEKYGKVRGEDRIETVLNSQKNMDFTHTQTDGTDDIDNQVSKYIRLLMPRYTRRVEVEDLNRNFWVIGQVLTAVCAYLFDDDSPIMNMFKRLLNENVQIWENLLYLWAAVSLLGEKDYVPYDSDHIRCEVVYVPNDEFSSEFKFDGYDVSANSVKTQTINLDKCGEKLKYLIDKYPNKHLCILPIVRKNNYFKNYYKQEIYYGLLYYDRNNGNGSWTKQQKFNNDNGLIIEVTNNDKLWYLKEKQNCTYTCCSPTHELDQKDDSYIRAIRSKVTSFKCKNNDLLLDELIITCYDVAKYIATSTITGSVAINILDPNYNNIVRTAIQNTIVPTQLIDNCSGRGVYLCEVPTKSGSPGVIPDPTTATGDAELLKMGNFLPEITSNNQITGGYIVNSQTPSGQTITLRGLGLMTDKNAALTPSICGWTVYTNNNGASTYDDDTYYKKTETTFYKNQINNSTVLDFSRKLKSTTNKYPYTLINSKDDVIEKDDNMTYSKLKTHTVALIKEAVKEGQFYTDREQILYICATYGSLPWIGGRNVDNKSTIQGVIGDNSNTEYAGRFYYEDAYMPFIFRIVIGLPLQSYEEELKDSSNNTVGYIDKILPLNLRDNPSIVTEYLKPQSPTNNSKWRIMSIKVPNQNINLDDPFFGLIQFEDGNDNNYLALQYYIRENSEGKIEVNYDQRYTYGYKWTNNSRSTIKTTGSNLPSILQSYPGDSEPLEKGDT